MKQQLQSGLQRCVLSSCSAAICMPYEAAPILLTFMHYQSQPFFSTYDASYSMLMQPSCSHVIHICCSYAFPLSILVTAHHAWSSGGKEMTLVTAINPGPAQLVHHHIDCVMPCRTSMSLLTPHGSSPQRQNSRAAGQQLKGAWPGSCCTVQMTVRIPD